MIVANVGLHMHSTKHLVSAGRAFIEDLANRRDETNGRTIVLWRESTAQHYNTRTGMDVFRMCGSISHI